MEAIVYCAAQPKEYFCKNCKQLRLDLTSMPIYYCKNCGSKDIVVGKIGELDKDGLLKEIQREEV